MSYAKSNPLFELDIYQSQIDGSWNFFLSVFRWSFAIQLSKPQLLNYSDYMDGNYSSQQKISSFEDEIEDWYEKDSVEGEEYDDYDYNELEGLYYSKLSDQFVYVSEFNQVPSFQILYENGFYGIKNETISAEAVMSHVIDSSWEKIASP
jgi:hypothetical protein